MWKIREIHDFGPTDEAGYVKKRRRFVFSPRFRLNYKNSINPLKKFLTISENLFFDIFGQKFLLFSVICNLQEVLKFTRPKNLKNLNFFLKNVVFGQ